MKRLIATAVALTLIVLPAADVAAWGASGHRMVGQAAMRALPEELPAFLRTAEAAAQVGELSREPDRWKGAGQPHGRERDTAHFVDMTADGLIMTEAGPHIGALPTLKSEYDALLLEAGIKVNDAGYLPYAIMDAWLQVVQDFAYWRVLTAAEARETDLARQAWYREDRLRREALLLRDIGMLSHYISDGSQPLHTTIHYNGWDRDTANPEGFTRSRQTHGLFEGEFVRDRVNLQGIEAAMAAPRLDGFELRARTADYLLTSLAEVVPFYRLEKAGAFVGTDPRGVDFATQRLAAGAAELRDLIVLAWRESGTRSIGWPAIKVAEVEAGTADPWLSMIGQD
ncbi:MAG: S1/P1 Nuclease [Brevundimonas sp.]|uniref:S1/P1 Nuclease n=1 Tax=Brevundimonas sp. TaxID=1871086 RepID=UPI00273282EB|nr:S1/P1 Nuclease [Brevundimonas sp.]MDP3379615.1 S1/P1 Nuclease [Brevundimonas sp.]